MAISGVILILSASANIVLAALLYRAKKKPPPAPTIEAKDILHDLTTKGSALISISVLDPEGLLMWRRR